MRAAGSSLVLLAALVYPACTGDSDDGGTSATMGGTDSGTATGGSTTGDTATGATGTATASGTSAGPGSTTNETSTNGTGGSGTTASTGATVTSTGNTSGTSTTGSTGSTGGAVPECSADGAAIVTLINEYRIDNNKPAIPISPSLCTVAQTHVEDLRDNAPHEPQNCNLHSWSDKGTWSACCYTPDHAQAQCMWDKPGELTVYPGNGYENSAAGTDTPAQAVNLWKGSPPHNDVILNLGTWANYPWGSVGAAIESGYAVVWFGEEADPAG